MSGWSHPPAPSRSCRSPRASVTARHRCGHGQGREGGPVCARRFGADVDQRPLLVYLFDPYCPWSHGYTEAVAELMLGTRGVADLQVVTTGLHVDSPVAVAAASVGAVRRRTGARFGTGFREAVGEGSMRLRSLDAAAGTIALLAAAPDAPDQVVREVHHAFFWDGLSLSDPATFAGIAERLGLDAVAVAHLAGSAHGRRLAEEDFSLARDLGAGRTPLLLLAAGERLVELDGPGVTGAALLDQVGAVLERTA